MTKEELFDRLAELFDSDEGSLDEEEWTEQMQAAKSVIAKFERAAMARAVRFAAKDLGPHMMASQLMLEKFADRIERGDLEVPDGR